MMELDELLTTLNQNRVVLIPQSRRRVVPWSPGSRIPRATRQAIRGQVDALLKLIESADSRVCPSPELHCCYGPTCFVCQRLDAAMRDESRPATRTYVEKAS